MNITDCLQKICDLTSQNLDILSAINDSFFTKQTNIVTKIDDKTFYIPSFLSLENKINNLQASFDNLVHAAQCGDAWMNFDGGSKLICLQSFQHTPNKYKPSLTNKFGSKHNPIFKDLLDPKPFVNFDISYLPENVTQVVVKKFIPYSSTLKENIKVLFNYADKSKDVVYQQSIENRRNDDDFVPELANVAMFRATNADIQRIVQSGSYSIKNGDYEEYDTVYNLPIKSLSCEGQYVINNVLSDIVNTNGDNIIEVSVDEPLTYVNGLGIEKNIEVGCILTNGDSTCQLKVVDLDPSTKTLKLQVMFGTYVYLHADVKSTTGQNVVDDHSLLRFYEESQEIMQINSTNQLYEMIKLREEQLSVTLEEDSMVFIAIAPLNSTTNSQAAWGTGVVVFPDNLANGNIKFRNYYVENVNNIGDSLVQLLSILPKSWKDITEEKYQELIETEVPKLSNNDLVVAQINEHLFEEESIKSILKDNDNVSAMKLDLDTADAQIAEIDAQLRKASFDTVDTKRELLVNQKTSLLTKRTDIFNNILKLRQTIQTKAKDSIIPIENAKYHVRGYIDIEDLKERGILDKLMGIEIEYRYKTGKKNKGKSMVINKFLFSEWKHYESPTRRKYLTYENGKFTTEYIDDDDHSKDVPKFNQIDIPITQGEYVQIRARWIWEYGYPFATINAPWSDIIEVEFPSDLIQTPGVLDVVNSNAEEIELAKFENVLSSKGVTAHLDTEVEDQNITYRHGSDNIASGFYTDERRVIPLSQVLQDFNSILSELSDSVFGAPSDTIKVTVAVSGKEYILSPGTKNNIPLPAYSTIGISNKTTQGSVWKFKTNSPAQAIATLRIKNESKYTVNLYSCFPGSYTQPIWELSPSRRLFDIDHFYTVKKFNASDLVAKPGASVDLVNAGNVSSTDKESLSSALNGIFSSNDRLNVSKDFNSLLVARRTKVTAAMSTRATEESEEQFVEDGVLVGYVNGIDIDDEKLSSYGQTCNQFLTFRLANPYDGSKITQQTKFNTLVQKNIFQTFLLNDESETQTPLETLTKDWGSFAFVGPYLNKSWDLCIPVSDQTASKALAPGQTISIPLAIAYKTVAGKRVGYSIGFNLRPSLYRDPLYYEATFNATYQPDTTQSTAELVDPIKTTTRDTSTIYIGNASRRFSSILNNK